MLAEIGRQIFKMIAELWSTIQAFAPSRGSAAQSEPSQITALPNLAEAPIHREVSGLPMEKRKPLLRSPETIESRMRPGPELVYCVMVPTHSNPTKGLLGITRRRKFSRRHDNVILNYVAVMHGGWTLLPRSRGCWLAGFGEFQMEGMSPFLFTAKAKIQADIIADLICIHYNQKTVMKFVWGFNVEFRKQWEMIPFFTNVLPDIRAGRVFYSADQ